MRGRRFPWTSICDVADYPRAQQERDAEIRVWEKWWEAEKKLCRNRLIPASKGGRAAMKLIVIAIAVVAALAVAPFVALHGEEPDPPDDGVIVIAPKTGGWTIEELFRLVAKNTGEAIVYAPDHPGIADREIEFVGEQRVPRKDLFAWFQSLLSFQGIVLVPVLGRKWMAVPARSPQVRVRPIFVPETDLEDWRDRRGVFLVTVVTLDRAADAARALELLGPLVMQDVGVLNREPAGFSLVIADYAPKVHALVRLARELSGQSARRIRRREELLAAARTETAARCFLLQIEKE